MADEKTRQDVVEENIEAVEDKYGPAGLYEVMCQTLKDISVSIAMLVDKEST